MTTFKSEIWWSIKNGMNWSVCLEFANRMSEYIKPRKEFSTKLNKIDVDLVTEACSGDIKQLEKHIEEFDPLMKRIPILLKKYLKQNARIIGFNVDPKFNNCLDGLMILDINRLPNSTFELLKK